MNPEDPLLALVAARNPVPDADALNADELAAAEALPLRIQSAAPHAGGHVGGPHAVRYLLIAAAAIVPVVPMLVLALGIRGSKPGSGGATTLSGALAHLWFKQLASELGAQPALRVSVQIPKPGQAQTLLVIGSDHHADESYSAANTDTMLLIRLNADSSTINLLSVPRDLKVQIPQGGKTFTGKLNAAYGVGGPNLLVNILKTQVFPGFAVNHVIDVNFAGFSDLVDAIGCVYSDVDRRYYNNVTQTTYSSIDIQPGYQQLCGQQALQFVRFRHTDDIVRNARQRDFLRWAKDGYSGEELLANSTG
jgi:LCP family protein required for cell wall assembly